ncbi:DNA N-glycosylase and apurinic/apyrimidinic (AP) lyase [Allomyces arbusculus]|nr:DNA N-glycosylase and apurinic/apyrimidinic (AP) lyase [Allomyces arbusculus]
MAITTRSQSRPLARDSVADGPAPDESTALTASRPRQQSSDRKRSVYFSAPKEHESTAEGPPANPSTNTQDFVSASSSTKPAEPADPSTTTAIEDLIPFIKFDPDALSTQPDPSVAATTSKSKRPKRPPAAATPSDAPPNWSTVYDRIHEWRATHPAPVDTVGCERLADENAAPRHFRFQTLVALMLSSQTKDEVTAAAMANLRAKGLTPEAVVTWEDVDLNAAIAKVGFHRRKTQYIKQTAAILLDEYGGDIPNTIEGLVALPGVGPKMGFLTLQCAWGINSGIGVDVHVHRIANRLGWVKTSQPEQTRVALESWLPKDKWRAINPLLVGFGQTGRSATAAPTKRKLAKASTGAGTRATKRPRPTRNAGPASPTLPSSIAPRRGARRQSDTQRKDDSESSGLSDVESSELSDV